MARKEPEPVRITTATRSRNEDINMRQRRYLISMGFRTVCFVLGICFIGHWYMWIFLGASFVVPYVAVVMANAGISPDPGGPDPFGPDPTRKVLEAPRSE